MNSPAENLKEFTIGDCIVELPKSKLPASEASDYGPYLFFCSSAEPKHIHTYLQNKPAIVIARNT